MRTRQEILATLSVADRFNTSVVQELGHPQSVKDGDAGGGAGAGPGGGLGGVPPASQILGSHPCPQESGNVVPIFEQACSSA
jgi:hypothetical protein